MTTTDPNNPALIWWGRSDLAYNRNAVIRAAMRRLGWAIYDYRSGLLDTLHMKSPTLPTSARLVWVPCFRQRDVATAARFAKRHGLPLVFDPLISAFDKQVFERGKFAKDSPQAKRLFTRERSLFQLADLVVADTAAHAAYFQEAFGLAKDRTVVIPVGADEAMFHPQEKTASTNGRVQVLFYGSFIALQGPETIAKAAAHCDAVDWCMLGEGPLRPACEAIVRGLEHVRFEPWRPFSELPERIIQADILLGVFSDSDKAGRVVPNKVYQAMASGRPVISRAPLPGTFPWSEQTPFEQSGVMTVPANDPAALADAVRSLASDPARRQQAGQAARATYEQHGSVTHVTQVVSDVLDRVLTLGGTH
ncbi:MAG: glycosyltransferase [Phycisphaeraceae bacterium]